MHQPQPIKLISNYKEEVDLEINTPNPMTANNMEPSAQKLKEMPERHGQGDGTSSFEMGRTGNECPNCVLWINVDDSLHCIME